MALHRNSTQIAHRGTRCATPGLASCPKLLQPVCALYHSHQPFTSAPRPQFSSSRGGLQSNHTVTTSCRPLRPRPVVKCMAVSPAATPSDYVRQGPLPARELDPFTIRVGGDSELPITAQIQVTVPVGAPRPGPLVLLSPGFLLNASLYASYSAYLASWGYTVASYDISEVMDDRDTVRGLKKILEVCTNGRRVQPYVRPGAVALVGHSRGGKLSALLAGEDREGLIKGLILLDPVDSTPMTPPGEGYPSALPGIQRCSGPPRHLPIAVVGAGSGGDVVPESGNFRRFAASARGPLWEVDLRGAGHLSFLDKQIGLFSLFSAPGSTPDEAVRAASKVVILTWLRHAVFAESGSMPCEQALEAARRVVAQTVRDELSMTHLRLYNLPRASQPQQTAASSSHSSSGPASSSQQQPRQQPQQRLPPITESYEQLMTRRAKELKAMLVERGVPCADCFEKEQLARRLVEACGPTRVTAR